jgi:hypothetical protein
MLEGIQMKVTQTGVCYMENDPAGRRGTTRRGLEGSGGITTDRGRLPTGP